MIGHFLFDIDGLPRWQKAFTGHKVRDSGFNYHEERIDGLMNFIFRPVGRCGLG
jgi:hypothetical protein